MNKRQTRKQCFSQIRALSDEEKLAASKAIVERIAGTESFQTASTVFTYSAMPGEPDLSELFKGHPDKRWAFSRVGEENCLSFHEVSSQEQLSPGPFSFPEPNPALCPVVEASAAELILIPGVGFDRSNAARLGRGKGHYDRFLEKALQSGGSPTLLGVCFSVQLTSLTPEPHDVPMSGIVTESSLDTCQA